MPFADSALCIAFGSYRPDIVSFTLLISPSIRHGGRQEGTRVHDFVAILLGAFDLRDSAEAVSCVGELN